MIKRIGKKILEYPELTSTNTVAARLDAGKGLPSGTVVRTNFQTDGKGQPGNSWSSEAGRNLLFTVIVKPNNFRADRQFLLSMAVSLGITDFLHAYEEEAFIKWPNDIYLGNDKIAGLLLEHRIRGSFLTASYWGIGVNVNQETFPATLPNPVSLRQHTRSEYRLPDLLDALLEHLDQWYSVLLEGDYQRLRSQYHKRLYQAGSWENYRIKGTHAKARILSVSDMGLIEIETEDGEQQELAFKELEYRIKKDQ